MESDGFTLVSRGSRRKVHRPRPVCKHISGESALSILGSLKPKLAESENRAAFICSQVLKCMTRPEIEGLVRKILTGLPSGFACRKIVCYGIGSFSVSCDNSRLQLALLLLLQKELGGVETEVYDPIHTDEDEKVLSTLGCAVGLDNTRGKKPSLCLNGSTLFVMPHCSMRLYSNLLWGLWNGHVLANIALVGNSFRSYEGRLIGKATTDETNCLSLLTGYTNEVILTAGLNNRSPLYSAFSDTSLVTFPRSKMQQAQAAGLFVKQPPEFLGELEC